MKSGIFKYIFILVIIFLIAYSVFTIYKGNQKENINLSTYEEKDIAMEKELRLAIAGFDTMNPILSQNKNVQEISKLIFDSLLNVSEDYQITLGLAKEVSKVDETTYLIKLKENVKWQNGKKFTTQDVKFTIEQIIQSNSLYLANVKNMTALEIIDDYTMKIFLNSEIPFFEYNLTFPIMSCEEYIEEEFATSTKNLMPIGTGRYRIISCENNRYSCQKNLDWWNIENDNAKIEELTINLYGTMGEVYNDFKLGNIDLITTSADNVEEYVGTIGYYRNEVKGREYDYIALNCASDILKYIEVRKAIEVAIDKSSINATVYANKYYEANFPLDNGNYLYSNKNAEEKGIEKAKKILLENGWEYKYKVWQKKEEYKTLKLNLKLVVNESNSARVAIAQQIKEQLEVAGIIVEVIAANDTTYQNYLNNKNYDMIISGTYTAVSPDLTRYFAENNLANFNSEEAKQILNEVKNLRDKDSLKEKYAKLSEIYLNEAPYISLFYNKNTILYNQRLVGNLTPNSNWNFYNFGTWYRQADETN